MLQSSMLAITDAATPKASTDRAFRTGAGFRPCLVPSAAGLDRVRPPRVPITQEGYMDSEDQHILFAFEASHHQIS